MGWGVVSSKFQCNELVNYPPLPLQLIYLCDISIIQHSAFRWRYESDAFLHWWPYRTVGAACTLYTCHSTQIKFNRLQFNSYNSLTHTRRTHTHQKSDITKQHCMWIKPILTCMLHERILSADNIQLKEKIIKLTFLSVAMLCENWFSLGPGIFPFNALEVIQILKCDWKLLITRQRSESLNNEIHCTKCLTYCSCLTSDTIATMNPFDLRHNSMCARWNCEESKKKIRCIFNCASILFVAFNYCYCYCWFRSLSHTL